MTNFLLFDFNPLAQIVTALVLFIGLVVGFFARNYLRGDKKYKIFFINLTLLVTAVIFMVCSDSVVLFPLFWFLSNAILVLMMIHKFEWKAAVNSGILAIKTFFIGFVCLVGALIILSSQTGEIQISKILTSEKIGGIPTLVATIMILVAAITQSGIWPFNSWLISSLNSPTPVSAIMHAGLVNGGGILLAKFSALYIHSDQILNIIFIVGAISVVLGTLWKLIQADVKKMLACSTMSQMGFMFVQCGLGLIPAAIAHFIFHGLFKSYLFLSSAGVWQEKRLDLGYPPKVKVFLSSLLIGFITSLIFARITIKDLSHLDTNTVLVFFAFIGLSQLALTILDDKISKNLFTALIICSLASLIYSLAIYEVEEFLVPLIYMEAHAINVFHVIVMAIFFLLWIGRIFIRNPKQIIAKKLYVKALNASQSNYKTVTSNRNQYQI